MKLLESEQLFRFEFWELCSPCHGSDNESIAGLFWLLRCLCWTLNKLSGFSLSKSHRTSMADPPSVCCESSSVWFLSTDFLIRFGFWFRIDASQFLSRWSFACPWSPDTSHSGIAWTRRTSYVHARYFGFHDYDTERSFESFWFCPLRLVSPLTTIIQMFSYEWKLYFYFTIFEMIRALTAVARTAWCINWNQLKWEISLIK